MKSVTKSQRGMLLAWGLLVVAALLPIGLLSVYSLRVTSHSVRSLVESNNVSASTITSEMVRRDLEQSVSLALVFARLPGVVTAVERRDEAEVRERLRIAVKSYPGLERAFVTDPSGVLWSDYPPAPQSLGENFSRRDWYQGLSQSWQPYVSRAYQRFAPPKLMVVAIAVPIRNLQNKPVGALVYQYRLEELSAWFKKINLGESGQVFLLDHSGTVAAHPTLDLQSGLHDEYAALEPTQQALQGQPRTQEYFDPVERRRMVATFQPVSIGRQYWVVVAQQPVAVAYAPIRRLASQIGLAGGLLSLLALAVVVGLARSSDHNRRLSREVEQRNERLQEEVAERQRAEELLRASSEQYRSLAEALPQIVWTAQPDGTLDYYNQRWFDYSGLSPEETRERGWEPILHPDDLQPCLGSWAQSVRSGEDYQFESRFQRASDGAYRWHLVRAVPLRAAEGEILKWFGTCTDIDDQKRAQEEMLRAKEAAEAATLAKSDFLANMSHELRTPLNAIIGFSEVLEDQTFGELNPRQTKYISNILTSGRHLLQLINDILDIAKIEAGRLTLDLTQFAVDNALNDVLAIVKTLAHKKNIDLTLDVEPDLPVLTADQSKFKQIMYNLLSNAIKFTPESGKVNVQVSLDATSNHIGSTHIGSTPALRIAVSDTGVGIKAEDQERIFGQFEQVDSSYSRQQQGTGLGLALTKNLVELHGGRIWMESEGVEGKGSTFIFVLPLKGVEAAADDDASLDSGGVLAPDVEIAAPGEEAAPAAPVVLVVEDDELSRELLTHYLTEAGYAVAYATDGERAVQMIRELRPYAVTLDIMMPKKDGWQVLADIKAAPDIAAVPVVIVSITEDRQLGISLGAVEFLVKPIDKNRLIEAVAKAGVGKDNEQMKVLVVDDEPKTVQLLTDLLQHQGYQVLSANGGRQGIELALEHLPDIIVLDLMMPEITGFDVVQRLHETASTRDIPIIIFSAKDITEEDRERLNSGIAGIVSKSGKEELLRELEKLKTVNRHA